MISRLVYSLKGLFEGDGGGLDARTDLALLSGQLREAGNAVRQARLALALASAQHTQDQNRKDRIDLTIQELEDRTRAALGQDQTEFAREGAEAIAILEDEREALDQSVRSFDIDLAALRENLRRTEARLRDLERGRQVARVRTRISAAGSASASPASLYQAEETLERINSRQERGALADKALAALSVIDRPKDLIARLADAGCGSSVRSSADAVLERLRSGTDKAIAYK
ncbi:PspA/IM30 family protein [Labrenzia sp. OB1]|uniref:PspA/IM30 family protein n=1 Tax=Labrenzia sp. OB1 TaxID=1561204 RepID=UPI000839214E|nr:PspA/IM30 family protein [Labrenzia sp. OB1]